jgi:assimilatory nitrate reductase catalytic subunit
MQQTAEIKTTCAYCGVGCGILVGADEHGAPTVKGDPEHPANYGRLCSKGSALHETLGLEDRLLYPQIGAERASWDDALSLVADKFSQAIAEHGPDSVAFYVSGQCLTEDYYVANKLMKGFIGSANIDTNSRLCMSSSVAGHVRAFGEDIVPGCYEDLEEADLLVLVGSNAAWCHPVLYQRMVAARDERGSRMVVIDPRGTATSDTSDLHLPIKPGMDALLWHGLLVWLDEAEALDKPYIERHVSGFDEALAEARAAAPDVLTVARLCGLNAESVARFYRWFANTEKTVTLYSQGINQSSSGTDKVNAILNCHFATGRVGKPGMGPFSLTGQPNAMGGREVGGLANMLAAHMALGDPEHTSLVKTFWDAPSVATKPGLKAVDLFQAVERGEIKALWVMATNPAVSLPEADRVKAALKACDFLVVSDVLAETDTTVEADVLLPALAWGEKDGTVTNSERRISRQRAFLPAPGEAKADWWALAEVAKRMGYAEAFDFSSGAEVFREHAALSGFKNRGTRAFDISGLSQIDNAAYDALQPIQWPVTAEYPEGAARLLGDGIYYQPGGRAAAMLVVPRGPKAEVSDEYPFLLNTGRVRDQWHTMTRTAKSPRLATHTPEPYVEMHPFDAKTLSLTEGSLAVVTSLHAKAVLRVKLSGTQQRGCVFAPMHWSGPYASDARVDALVGADVDPVSGQPEFKQSPVQVAPFAGEWYGFLMASDTVQLSGADYWAKSTSKGFHWYEIAGLAPLTDMQDFARSALIPAVDAEWISFVDAARGEGRFAVVEGGKLKACLFLSKTQDLVSRDWLLEMMMGDLSRQDRMGILSGRPTSGASAGPTVCACFNVGLSTLTAAITEQGLTSVEAIGAALSAGTNCGSCKPELAQLLREIAEPNASAA